MKAAIWSMVVLCVLADGGSKQVYSNSTWVGVAVSGLYSANTHIPVDYYSLNFCRPPEVSPQYRSFGDRLEGHSTSNSVYRMQMGVDLGCVQVCTLNSSEGDLERMQRVIDNEYQVVWLVDDLPAGLRLVIAGDDLGTFTRISSYTGGVPVGFRVGEEYYLNNHLHFTVKIHREKGKAPAWSVVGLLVTPLSSDSIAQCKSEQFSDVLKAAANGSEVVSNAVISTPISLGGTALQSLQPEIRFSYSVSFEETDIDWMHRWDNYAYNGENRVRIVALINAGFLVLVLTAFTAYRLKTEFRKTAPEVAGDSAWTKLSGDVFRPPPRYSLFAAWVASGDHLIVTCVATLCVAGLLPIDRLTVALTLFVVLSAYGGYRSARLHQFFGGTDWLWTAFVVAGLVPGWLLSAFLTVKGLQWSGGSELLPLRSVLFLVGLWGAVLLPVTLLGSLVNFTRPPMTAPGQISDLENPLIEQRENKRFWGVFILLSMVPFACVSVELETLLRSLWSYSFTYTDFSFLCISLLLAMVATADLSLLIVHNRVQHGDYRWWWVSLCPGLSFGLWVGGYSLFLGVSKFQVEGVLSWLLFSVYPCVAICVCTATMSAVGFQAAFCLLQLVYS